MVFLACITLQMLSEREYSLKYNNTCLDDHRELFLDDIEGVELVEISVSKKYLVSSKME